MVLYVVMVVLFYVNVLEVMLIVLCVGLGIGLFVIYLVIDDLYIGWFVCVLLDYWLMMFDVYVMYVLCCFLDVKVCIFVDYLCVMLLFVLKVDVCVLDVFVVLYGCEYVCVLLGVMV